MIFLIDEGQNKYTMKYDLSKRGLPINSYGYPSQHSGVCLPVVWRGETLCQFFQHDFRMAPATHWPWIAEKNLQGIKQKAFAAGSVSISPLA